MGKLNFISQEPTLAEYWRSAILFGNNVACYKFALAKSLLEIAPTGQTFVTLEELAAPFARHICDHLQREDKQTTSQSSKFLDGCRRFNAGEMSPDELRAFTVREGFNNVIDAFHHVNRADLPSRFFTDERTSGHRGIAITDELFELMAGGDLADLTAEVEARWRLVETAWGLNISRNLIRIERDEATQMFYAIDRSRRVDVTSCRDALNGYQKGKCFHCFDRISIQSGAANLAAVDHFFPHRLKLHAIAEPIDGVWNLVLACNECNGGVGGKFDRLPAQNLLQRLHDRNEFLIDSHHPLRETLIQQTGKTEKQRGSFLTSNYEAAKIPLGNSQWQPELKGIPIF
jgi:hypothetical protein